MAYQEKIVKSGTQQGALDEFSKEKIPIDPKEVSRKLDLINSIMNNPKGFPYDIKQNLAGYFEVNKLNGNTWQISATGAESRFTGIAQVQLNQDSRDGSYSLSILKDGKSIETTKLSPEAAKIIQSENGNIFGENSARNAEIGAILNRTLAVAHKLQSNQPLPSDLSTLRAPEVKQLPYVYNNSESYSVGGKKISVLMQDTKMDDGRRKKITIAEENGEIKTYLVDYKDTERTSFRINGGPYIRINPGSNTNVSSDMEAVLAAIYPGQTITYNKKATG
jgi:hypothetical protein